MKDFKFFFAAHINQHLKHTHGTHCCGFQHSQGQWIFMADKNPQHALPSEGE
jgi:hypothetical protein